MYIYINKYKYVYIYMDFTVHRKLWLTLLVSKDGLGSWRKRSCSDPTPPAQMVDSILKGERAESPEADHIELPQTQGDSIVWYSIVWYSIV